jgi:hypothetical protein
MYPITSLISSRRKSSLSQKYKSVLASPPHELPDDASDSERCCSSKSLMLCHDPTKWWKKIHRTILLRGIHLDLYHRDPSDSSNSWSLKGLAGPADHEPIPTISCGPSRDQNCPVRHLYTVILLRQYPGLINGNGLKNRSALLV